MRSDLNIFKQYINQQNLEIKIFTNDLQTKYDIQASHMQQLVLVNLFFINHNALYL